MIRYNWQVIKPCYSFPDIQRYVGVCSCIGKPKMHPTSHLRITYDATLFISLKRGQNPSAESQGVGDTYGKQNHKVREEGEGATSMNYM